MLGSTHEEERSSMNAKQLLAPICLAAALASPLVGGVSAHQADHSSSLEHLGLPEITITVTDDAITAPTEAAAGPTLIRLDNQSQYYATVYVAQPPEEVTGEDIVASFGGDFPEWGYETVFAGGPAGGSGTTSVAVVNLAPGE